jgi:xanthine dehydrogenase accessory factor
MTAQGTFGRLARDGERGALVTVLTGPHAGEHLLVGANGGTEGAISDPQLHAAAIAAGEELMWQERSERRGELFIDVVAAPPKLLIFGAVEYANHLSHYAAINGWRSYVIDPRAQFATRERFPHATAVIAAWPERAITEAGGIDRSTSVAVVTHDPKIDDEALRLALAADPAYIGAMGSKRAQAARRERLLAGGVPEPELERISAPIGLDLGAVGAEEVAVSIMGELLAVRHGRPGGRLCQREYAGSIH